jgi:hypothetical protein
MHQMRKRVQTEEKDETPTAETSERSVFRMYNQPKEELTKEDLDIVNRAFISMWSFVTVTTILFIYSIVAIPLHALIVMLAWNYVMPSLFNLHNLGYIQSLCLIILSRLLIKSTNTYMKS